MSISFPSAEVLQQEITLALCSPSGRWLCRCAADRSEQIAWVRECGEEAARWAGLKVRTFVVRCRDPREVRVVVLRIDDVDEEDTLSRARILTQMWAGLSETDEQSG